MHRIAKGWGQLPEECWPGQENPNLYPLPNEPPNADEIAKYDRLISYRRFNTEHECLISFERNRALSASIEISKDWHSPANGRIPLHLTCEPLFVHSIAIIAFDLELLEFLFPNSWGTSWGDNGFGYLPWGYLTKYMNEGWSRPLFGPQAVPSKPGINVLHRSAELPGLGTEVIIEILDGDTNVMIGWTIAVQRTHSFNVEELFVRPDYRNRGYGKRLAKELIDATAGLKTPLSFWIPWGDHEDHNASALLAWARCLGLRLEPAGVRWAAYKAMQGTPVESAPKLEWIPQRATCSLDLLTEKKTDDAIQQMFASAWDRTRAERRHQLIEQKYQSTLTAEESDELDELQLEFGNYQDSIAPLPPN